MFRKLFILPAIISLSLGLSSCNTAMLAGMADGMSGRSSSSGSAVDAQKRTCIANGGIWMYGGGCQY